jgi:hypothetical protein
MTSIGHLPPGSRGFDCNAKVSRADAARFYAAGYRFAVRYVRRATVNPQDITAGEIAGLLEAGLGVMLVQHFAGEGWHPTADMGRMYGTTAALDASRVGYPRGAQLWCDLEGVAAGTPPSVVIDYCNRWHESVQTAGFRPGLYVGYGARLTATQLFRALRFDRYWAAYNLNADQYPAVRGVCMRQHAFPLAKHRVPGVHFEYDVDDLGTDALGGSPTMLLPWAP